MIRIATNVVKLSTYIYKKCNKSLSIIQKRNMKYRLIIVKLLKISCKEEVLKEAREKTHYMPMINYTNDI